MAEAPATGVAPETVISCHTPPEALIPLPLACPGAVSEAKVYSGCPSQAAWVVPSDLVMVLSGRIWRWPAGVVNHFRR